MKTRISSLILTVLASVLVGTARGQTLTTIYHFSGADGRHPAEQSWLVEGFDGNLYGTTTEGGTNYDGTVFRITPAGTLTTLHQFDYDDGYIPNGVIQGMDGNFYGTTQEGGTDSGGTVFRVTSAGTFTTLYEFPYSTIGHRYTDGTLPYGQLVQGMDTNFYGTTQLGGTNGLGTVFRITPTGTLTTLYQFSGPDGQQPAGALAQGLDGNFYGTTSGGGTNAPGYGTVYRVTPTGTLTTLYHFDHTDGDAPQAGPVLGMDGYFYGTTIVGGTNHDGNVYRISSSGSLTSLYQFSGPDGYEPHSALSQGCNGNFYGTTPSGGANGWGTVFRITPAGVFSNLHDFAGNPEGGVPSVVIPASDGNLYGLTESGGTNNLGTVFRIADTILCPITMSCPSNIVVASDPGQCTAFVHFDVTVGGGIGAVSASCAPPPDSYFYQGTTPVVCTAHDAGGQTTNCSFNVTVTQPAAQCGITVGGDSLGPVLCPGRTAVLTAPNGKKHYLWHGPERDGATVQTIVVGTQGLYTCTQENWYDGTNCCSVYITVLPAPTCLITHVGSLAICPGQSVTLVGPAGMKRQYWLGPQNNGLNTVSNTVSVTGTYTLHIVDNNGCENACAVAVTRPGLCP